MGQIDQDKKGFSQGFDRLESTEEQEQAKSDDQREITANFKLVPVSESIRYRKRAQSAEKKAELLAEQLAQAKTQAAKLAQQLNDVQLEQRLTHKLAQAGAIDLETAVLIAKARTNSNEDLDTVVEQLKKEKQYLFADSSASITPAKKTAAPKDRLTDARAVLERAAKKAATTGNRADLQEYLRLRRNFI